MARLLGVAYYHADDHQRAIEQLVPLVNASDKLPEGSLERREAIQVLGLCYYLTGQYAEAIPLLEETRVWALDNLELGYILGLAYVQARQPDARESVARSHVRAAAGFGRRARRRRADDAEARDGAAGRG